MHSGNVLVLERTIQGVSTTVAGKCLLETLRKIFDRGLMICVCDAFSSKVRGRVVAPTTTTMEQRDPACSRCQKISAKGW